MTVSRDCKPETVSIRRPVHHALGACLLIVFAGLQAGCIVDDEDPLSPAGGELTTVYPPKFSQSTFGGGSFLIERIESQLTLSDCVPYPLANPPACVMTGSVSLKRWAYGGDGMAERLVFTAHRLPKQFDIASYTFDYMFDLDSPHPEKFTEVSALGWWQVAVQGSQDPNLPHDVEWLGSYHAYSKFGLSGRCFADGDSCSIDNAGIVLEERGVVANMGYHRGPFRSREVSYCGDTWLDRRVVIGVVPCVDASVWVIGNVFSLTDTVCVGRSPEGVGYSGSVACSNLSHPVIAGDLASECWERVRYGWWHEYTDATLVDGGCTYENFSWADDDRTPSTDPVIMPPTMVVEAGSTAPAVMDAELFSGTPESRILISNIFGDVDNDGTVAGGDYGVFATAFMAPPRDTWVDPTDETITVSPATTGYNVRLDYDGDGVIGGGDFGVFGRCYNGAAPADPLCAAVN